MYEAALYSQVSAGREVKSDIKTRPSFIPQKNRLAMPSPRITLIITGSIAAYKSMDLLRECRRAGIDTQVIMTTAAQRFITPLTAASLSGHPVYTDLWSLTDETEMGHIRLSRESDLLVVAPASANIIAQCAYGMADDLASAVLLASNRPILMAPAMNVEMWKKPSVQRNVAQLTADGVQFIGPASGTLACGEEGEGRMSETGEILDAIRTLLSLR